MYCYLLSLSSLLPSLGESRACQWHFSNCRSVQCIFPELLKVFLLYLMTVFSSTSHHSLFVYTRYSAQGQRGHYPDFTDQRNKVLHLAAISPEYAAEHVNRRRSSTPSAHILFFSVLLLLFPPIFPAALCPPNMISENDHSRAKCFCSNTFRYCSKQCE